MAASALRAARISMRPPGGRGDGPRGVSGLRAHVVAHLEMMQRLRQTRSAIQDGDAEAILDVVDLLETQRRHTAMFDIPAYEEILRRPNGAERGDSERETELARLKRMAA